MIHGGPRGAIGAGGGGPAGAGSWTPASASPAPFAWLDGDTGATGTSPVTAWASRVGSSVLSSGGAARPGLTAPTLNGHKGIAEVATSQIYTSTGGVTGANPWSAYAVGGFSAVGASSFGNIAIIGNPVPNTQDASCTVGGTYGGAWWGGCYDSTSNPKGGTADTLDHVFLTAFDGTNVFFWVDGTYIAKYPLPLSLSAGFGVANWFTGSFGTTGRLYSFVGRSGFDLASVRAQHLQYLSTHYGLTMPDVVIGVGDSLTYGSGSSDVVTKSYIGQLGALLGGWSPSIFKHGFPGVNTAGILADIQADTTPLEPGGGLNRFAIIEGGTNDAFAGADGAPGLAALKAYMESLGMTVLAQTVPSWINGHPGTWGAPGAASAASSNAYLRAAFPASRLIDVAADSRFALTSGGTAYDGTYRIAVGSTNEGHFTDAGYLVVAQIAATRLLGLKR